MTNSRDILQYRMLRYDYYHGGRLLHLMGNFHAAGILLGYAVETTMKAGLLEVFSAEERIENDRLLKSHDVKRIFVECKKRGIFVDVEVSDEFLEHVNNNFLRYPSQREKAFEQASKNGKLMGNSTDWLYYYDDLVVQMDYCLFKSIADHNISLFYHALMTLETQYALDVLRENVFACLKFDEYASVVRENMPEREDIRESIKSNLSRGAVYYFGPNKQDVSKEAIGVLAKKYSVSNFVIPRWFEEDGQWVGVIP